MELQQFTVDSMERPGETSPRCCPTTSQAVLVTAGTLLTEIDQATQQLCPTCSGSTIGQVPAFLVSAAEGLLGDLLTPTSDARSRSRGAPADPGQGQAVLPGQGHPGWRPVDQHPVRRGAPGDPRHRPRPPVAARTSRAVEAPGRTRTRSARSASNVPGGGTPTGGGGVDGPVKDLVDGVSGLVDGLTDPLLP